MPLLLSSDQELIRKVVHEFAEKTLKADATRVDRESRFPREHLKQMAELGLVGMLVPADRGGAGSDTTSFLIAVEEVSKASATDAALLILQNTLQGVLLDRLANAEQRERLLVPLLRGERVGAIGVTEEAGGSSYREFLTTARPDAQGYQLRGSKAFVAIGSQADHIILLAALPPQEPTFFIAEKGAPGFHYTEPESTLGLRGLPLCDLYLNEARVGRDSVLGEVGKAWDSIREPLFLTRLGVSAALVGCAQAAYEMARDFSLKRIQFGQPISNFGAIRGMIADVEAELEAARATLYGAAALRDSGQPYDEEAYEARLLAQRIAVKGTRIAHRIHGGAGFMRDLPLERVSRDVRTLMHMWDAQDITRARLAAHLLR